jgi:hypothetical protein
MDLLARTSSERRGSADLRPLRRGSGAGQCVSRGCAGGLAPVVERSRTGPVSESHRQHGVYANVRARKCLRLELAPHSAAGLAHPLDQGKLCAGSHRRRAHSHARRTEQLDDHAVSRPRGDAAGDDPGALDLRAGCSALPRLDPIKHRADPRARFARHCVRT